MGTTATRRSIMTYCSTGPPDVGYPAPRPPAASAPGVVARGVVDGDGLGAGADPPRCDHHAQVLNELSHRLPRDAAVPDVDSGAPAAHGNPAAAGSFPASQRLRRCARQGAGAVAGPSGVDDARQDRPRYGLAERSAAPASSR